MSSKPVHTYKDLEGVALVTMSLKKTKLSFLELNFPNRKESISLPGDGTVERNPILFSLFEVVTTDSGSTMSIWSNDIKSKYAITDSSDWSLWVHNPNYMAKSFHLTSLDNGKRSLLWVLFDLSEESDDDEVLTGGKVKVIWRGEIGLINNDPLEQQPMPLLEFEDGWAMFLTGAYDKYKQVYDSIVVSN